MKVVAFNGSPRRDGNTAALINVVLDQLDQRGIDTELVHLAGKRIKGCVACYGCSTNKDKRCAVADDELNECIEKMLDAEGMILGSPTYFANVTPAIKALIDRSGLVALTNGGLLKRKVGVAVAAVRRGGAIHVFNSINHFFFINQMIVPGSNYWNFGIGRDKGQVGTDREGIRTMEVLGRNMAWLLTKLYG
jgi:multimeric flavodoxin WrbA